MSLTEAQIELYSRQIILREVGGIGQRKLLAARCLVVGAGAARDVAASYLAGAGVGFLDLWDPERGAERTQDTLAALPPLAARGADTQTRVLDAPGAGPPDGYEVVLCFAAEPGVAPRPRLGSVLVRPQARGGVELVVLPGETACVACLAPADAGHGPGRDLAGALASAGALAALACCRLLLGLDAEPEPRALRLAAGDVAWTEHAPALLARCPRGCPPRVEPV